MVRIGGKKFNLSRKKPWFRGRRLSDNSYVGWVVLIVCLGALVSHFSENDNDGFPLLWSLGRRKGGVIFEAIPPEKRAVVVETSRGPIERNDVVSNVRMGVLVDWMVSTDWESDVGTLDGQQHFHGYYGLEKDGKPAWRPQPYIHYNSESLTDKTLHHSNYSFNKWRSDQLPLSLPRVDQRSPQCRELAKSGYYQNQIQLPNTSVIFVAYNEPLSSLFRSIHSVLDRTPKELLHEIIVVDDGSDHISFGEELESYIGLLPKTKLFRLPKRKGLMAARIYGAQKATGDTLTFLDSHIEAMRGWLPPLLERIAVDRKVVTVPVIDQIDPDTWEYTLGGISILGFTWSINQNGVTRPTPANKTAPMPSPIMAGGLFTMDRKWFFELGAYDPELQFWGGEEMEISWKIWQCGGRLECIPCSGVGHIFRSAKHWQGSVHQTPFNVIQRNRLRAAAVWMDPPHYQLVLETFQYPSNTSVGDLSQMKAIRENLKCKSFQWYLDNVYPELFFPSPEKILWVGEVRQTSSNKCLDSNNKKTQGDLLGVFPCHGNGGNQKFLMSARNELRIPGDGWDICIDGNGGGEHQQVILYKCHGGGGAQSWIFDETTKQFKSLGHCLSYNSSSLTMERCIENDIHQMWAINKAQKLNP